MFGRFVGIVFGLIWIAGVQAAPEPQAIELGGGKLIPTLKVALKHDDNIFSQFTREVSDTILQVAPEVQWLQEKGTTSLAITYTGDYGVYKDSDDDDYDDHTLSFDAALSPTDIFRFDFGASYGWLHDNRGEGSSEGINALTRGEPDEYEIGNVNLELDFGRESSLFGFRLSGSQDDIEYQNNRNETIFRDRDETYFAARLYGKISGGKTKFFVEASEKDFSYDENPILGGTLDSDESGWAVGVEWEATAKTSGSILVGEVEKEFDSAVRGEEDIDIWEVEIIWSPRTYSHVLLNASNTPQETNGTGSFIESQDTSLAWIHDWSDRVHSIVSFSDGTDEYANSLREDDRQTVSVGLSYDWRRWLTVSGSYAYQERDSNADIFDFEKNVVTISLDMSL